MEMETRVAKMESEMRVLRAALERVPQNILRELTARGALLMVQAPAAVMEDVVAKGIQAEKEKGEGPAVIEEEEEEEKPRGASEEKINGGEDGGVAIVPRDEEDEDDDDEEKEQDDDDEEEEEQKPWEMDAVMMQDARVQAEKSAVEKEESSDDSSDDDEDEDSGDSSDSDQEMGTSNDHEDQRVGMETSQESAASSGSVAEPKEQTTLSLSAFDATILKPAAPTPAAPSCPQPPFKMPQSSAPPLRPLALARRPEVTLSARPASKPVRIPASVPVSAPSHPVVVNLPMDFEVQTKDSVGVAWEKWCCGDAFRGFPPFRLIMSKHVANKAVLRRLSDLRCAMLPIETLVKERELWSESLTPQQAARIYQQLAPLLPLSQALPSGRERKKEIAWSTALNIMRRGKKRKHPPTTTSNNNSSDNGNISETLI